MNQNTDVSKGILYLIPTVLAEDTAAATLSAQVVSAILETDHYFVEEARTARRFISSLKTGKQIADLHFYILDKDTTHSHVKSYFKDIPAAANIGIISEAGCPGIADPGALAVELSHQAGRTVKPLVGPSSILLALMASGFNGQSFTFHGYLPIDGPQRIRSLQQMEQEAVKHGRTQIFMETPYRNNQLMKDMLEMCNPATRLCIAANITAANEFIKTMKIRDWKSAIPDLHKQPAIFLIYC
jgi:16S rRNA (cytidine1402-2'-O)-methyltransferase